MCLVSGFWTSVLSRTIRRHEVLQDPLSFQNTPGALNVRHAVSSQVISMAEAKTFFLSIHSNYCEIYGQNQISAIQFSHDGLHLAIVTEDR